jgi:asparagine synthetase B (glutamine-hydrolysing)
MFALALWEPGRRGLLARDPTGIKPLYWSGQRGSSRSRQSSRRCGARPGSRPRSTRRGGGVLASTRAGAADIFEGARKLGAGTAAAGRRTGDPVLERYAEPRPCGRAGANGIPSVVLAAELRDALRDSCAPT